MRDGTERSQDVAERTVKDIRRKTRKRYSAEEKIRWSGRPLPTASQCAMLAVSPTPTEGEGVHGSGYHHRDRSGEA